MSNYFYVPHPVDGHIVVVVRGESGYHELDYPLSPESADAVNVSLGNSPAEVSAAVACSMFGWDNFERLVNDHS